jgi:hypothetical protein
MGRYRKFVTAIVGAIVTLALRHYGYNDPALNDVVAGLTAIGVYAVPND